MQGHMLLSVFALALVVTWVPVESSILSHLVHHEENELHEQEHKLVDPVKNEVDKIVTHIETEAEKKEDGLGNLLTDVIQPVVHTPRGNTGCQCVEYNCGCCAEADVPEIHLDDSVCINVSYLPTEYGVSLTITVDNHVIFSSTVSASNPSPICAGVPYLEKEASICVELYNLDVTNSTFSGCAKLEVRLFGILLEDYDLGCFEIPLGQG